VSVSLPTLLVLLSVLLNYPLRPSDVECKGFEVAAVLDNVGGRWVIGCQMYRNDCRRRGAWETSVMVEAMKRLDRRPVSHAVVSGALL
jgi:cytidine deaminase